MLKMKTYGEALLTHPTIRSENKFNSSNSFLVLKASLKLKSLLKLVYLKLLNHNQVNTSKNIPFTRMSRRSFLNPTLDLRLPRYHKFKKQNMDGHLQFHLSKCKRLLDLLCLKTKLIFYCGSMIILSRVDLFGTVYSKSMKPQ